MSVETMTQGPQGADSHPDGTAAADAGREAEAGAAERQELTDRIAALEREIMLRDEDIEAVKRALELTREELAGARAAYAFAVADYKRLVCEHHPLVPPEAVTGDTIEEVKASLKRTNDLIARVKQAIAEQAGEVVVPAGAPPRHEPDMSALSAKEKIAYAVRNRQAK